MNLFAHPHPPPPPNESDLWIDISVHGHGFSIGDGCAEPSEVDANNWRPPASYGCWERKESMVVEPI